MTKSDRIGDLLIQAGLVDDAALARALEAQSRQGGSLGRALANLGLADEEAVTEALARGLHFDYLGSDLSEITPEVTLIPVAFCRKHSIVPLSLQGSTLRLAINDPLAYAVIQDAEFASGKKVTAVVASQTSIQKLLDRFYPVESEGEKNFNLLSSVNPAGEVEVAGEAEYEIVDAAKLAKDTKLPPIVRLVNLILSDAAKGGASDIHIEPYEKGLQVRHRVDGLLHDALKIPKEIQDATVSRIKIISGMDIAERRKPQDGRCRLRIEGKRIDLRVSTLPTQFGEKVVIRILDSSKAQIPIEQMGFAPGNLRKLQSALSRPQGMILVTGPTGSGKTSTLYTSLNWVKSKANNIVTVEDPIELQLPGISQVQINTKAGMTFAAGLRSILRQDPDIILVGEIRDEETAGIAVEAAQTGHLLLSTLHTNDAPATVTRLFDLGIEPFEVGAALVAVVSQRLVRKVCPSCAAPQAPGDEAAEKAGGAARLPANAGWVAGKGCDQCGQTGFKGRLSIHEILEINDDLRALIARRAPEHELRQAARAAGMKTLMEDGVAKAAQGLTTLEELVRVAPKDDAGGNKAERSNAPAPSPSQGAHEVLAPPPPPASPVIERRAASLASSGQNGQTRSASGKDRVLIVEDSPTIVSVVKYFLELEGFEVLVAENGVDGLAAARRELPRVIVSDVNMPGMDGVSMVRAIRADPATQTTAIMLLTSESSVESETQGLEAGADDYVLKPVEPRRLAARVKALMARAQARPAA